MAQRGGSNSNKRRIEAAKTGGGGGGSSDGVLSRLNESVFQSPVFIRSKKAASVVFRKTRNAFWYIGTSLLVLAVPLIIELDREAQLVELEGHQTTVLGSPSQPPPGFLMRV